jgi:hypothetical protein
MSPISRSIIFSIISLSIQFPDSLYLLSINARRALQKGITVYKPSSGLAQQAQGPKSDKVLTSSTSLAPKRGPAPMIVTVGALTHAPLP